jgi:hypothetical protein
LEIKVQLVQLVQRVAKDSKEVLVQMDKEDSKEVQEQLVIEDSKELLVIKVRMASKVQLELLV